MHVSRFITWSDRHVLIVFLTLLSPQFTAAITMASQAKTWRRRSVHKKMLNRLVKLKGKMKEINEEQGMIRNGQTQVREKFEAIISECQKLRGETMVIMQQSMWTRLRLALMFQILKAQRNNYITKAA